jgi:hypothetical protein
MMALSKAQWNIPSVLTAFFKSLHDGVPKEYPTGDMLLFIPMNEHMQYCAEYRMKLIYNHKAFVGNEEAITINGLQNLNKKVKLKDGKEITIRLLLKSLPAMTGMSRPQFFLFVEPNNSDITALATFQSMKNLLLVKRKSIIESELRAIIAPSESHKLFVCETEGLWYDGI